MTTNETTHTAGELAFIDSFAGLIPCKVLEVHKGDARVKTTADRSRWGYPKGEQIILDSGWVVPRSHVRHTRLGSRISGNYRRI
jgi:hypothetical protein